MSIRRSLPDSVFQSLIVALFTPRLDNGNATLAGIPTFQHRRLESVLNATARYLVTSTLHLYCETSIGCGLGSASISSQPCMSHVYTVLLLAISDHFQRVASYNRRRLRSSSSSSLLIRPTRLITVGDGAFPVAGSRLSNSLPHVVTSAPTLAVFWNRLKTFLFSRSFMH